MPALVQYASTVYWGIILTFNLLLVVFITTWIHINTMTKRQARIEALLRKLDKRLDEAIDEIAAVPAPTQPPSGYMPMYPVQPQQPPPYQTPR